MSNPWMKFYPQDWQGDEGLQMCSLSARGLWIEMLCIMHKNGGYLSIGDQPVTDALLAIKVGVQVEQVTELICELENLNVFSRTRAGVIYSRRMLSDQKKSQIAKKNGKNGGADKHRKNKDNSGVGNQNPNPPPNLPKKPEARNQKEKKQTKKESHWWAGEVIKLDRRDYEAWLKRFGGNDDKFTDWLIDRDRWYQNQSPQVQKNWFFSTSAAIEKCKEAA